MPSVPGRRRGARGRTAGADAEPLPVGSIYPPREDTYLLLPFARVRAGTSVLEVGTGSGAVALAAARAGARVVATDKNPYALRRLRSLARQERLEVAVVRTDLANGLGRFDRVLANPPYLPTGPGQNDPDRWHSLAVDGGPDGCATTARLVASLEDHLAPGGTAYLVASTVQSAARLRSIWGGWRARGGAVRRVAARPLEGERLEVYRLEVRPTRCATPRAPRTRGPRRGTGGRPRSRRGPRSA
jgi:release factor glutamine methyltransferase